MAHKLADETLAAILSDSLAIRDVDFANTTDEESPFAFTQESSSSLLVVCKRWMRVATPLLYDTVVLRSMPQAQALAAALKSNENLGRFIKKLRVEGGYGASVPKILKAAPTITDLCVTLHLFATENVAPMYKALADSAVRPTRLIICEPKFYLNKNKQVELAVSGLSRCIATWTSLRIVALADSIIYECPEVLHALYKAAHLVEIYFPQQEPGIGSRLDFRTVMSRLAESCFASIIRCGWPETDVSSRFSSSMKEGLSLIALEKVRFTDIPLTAVESAAQDVIAQGSNALYVPMENAPRGVRERIWSLILQQVIVHTTGMDAVKREVWNTNVTNWDLRLPSRGSRVCRGRESDLPALGHASEGRGCDCKDFANHVPNKKNLARMARIPQWFIRILEI